jgi:hypothetical protein
MLERVEELVPLPPAIEGALEDPGGRLELIVHDVKVPSPFRGPHFPPAAYRRTHRGNAAALARECVDFRAPPPQAAAAELRRKLVRRIVQASDPWHEQP